MEVALRDARRGDEPAVAELHIRSWQEAYRGIMPADFLTRLDPEERAGRYEFEGGEESPTTVLAVETGLGREGVGEDPSLTNSVEVRSGSSQTPFERIIGFATFGPSRDADAAGLGEIYALYVDPERYAGGIGRMLMVEARRRLREQGMESAVLWVLRGNERAQRFYEREGWESDGAQRFEQPYGIRSDVIRFHRILD